MECAVLIAFTSFSLAAPPALKHLAPVAGAQGTTTAVTATGTFNPWPVKIWVDAPGITFKPGDKAGKFDVEVAKDAATGPHLVRAYNADGASGVRFFIVAEHPDIAEAEPNDDFKAPQKVDHVPAVISGKLDKSGDVDSFALTMKKGETLTAWLEAYVLGSTFDGMLRIVDQNGTELAFNHDGRTLDPYLVWQAPREGTYIIQTMGFVYPATADVRFTGGEGCIYRLHLSEAPARAPFAGEPGTAEKEPNDDATTAQALELPGAIVGRIDRPRDVDRFSFTAQKQHAYTIKLAAAAVGSPLDGWINVENKEGKQLARNDDADGSRDPQLTWTAPADGTYFLAVGDVTHRGGADFIYRLSVAEAQPTVTATVAADTVVLKAGAKGDVKVNVKRTNGFTAKLKVVAKDLPAGVTAAEVDAPAKDGEATLKLEAAKDAEAANQPFQVALREADTGKEHPATFNLVSTTEDNGVPKGYKELVLEGTDRLWLTVIAAPKPTPAPAAAPTATPAPAPAAAKTTAAQP